MVGSAALTLVPIHPEGVATKPVAAVSWLFPREAKGGRRGLVTTEAPVAWTGEPEHGCLPDLRSLAVRNCSVDRDRKAWSSGHQGHLCDVLRPKPWTVGLENQRGNLPLSFLSGFLPGNLEALVSAG